MEKSGIFSADKHTKFKIKMNKMSKRMNFTTRFQKYTKQICSSSLINSFVQKLWISNFLALTKL